ncbi:hypothetical protein [Mesorhizobium sp. Root157]|uniref:hypothetical protein n=1 Tax=Mesorhizobium sp. Root157 TaxID=1736477 RepID=UPI0009EBE858|nr:hypothetical protein [Mesorhizobium sp. Root157]
MPVVHITDRAVLRYLERAHGLDVTAVRRHLAGRLENGARLGAVGVTIDNVKFVLQRDAENVSAVTALFPQWPART